MEAYAAWYLVSRVLLFIYLRTTIKYEYPTKVEEQQDRDKAVRNMAFAMVPFLGDGLYGLGAILILCWLFDGVNWLLNKAFTR